MLKLAPRIRIEDFTYDDGSPWVLRCSTIQAYPRDRYDPRISKLCADPFQDTKQIFKIRITVKTVFYRWKIQI